MVTLITPTCDQPIGFGLCEQWMRRQTVPLASMQWIVVDDGIEPATPTCGQQYVRRIREPDCSGAQSLCRNLLAALPLARGEHIVLIEHDDWYAPTHVASLVDLLASRTVLAAGDDKQRYYHVGARRWKVYQNRGAALCQTGFRRALLPLFQRVVQQSLAANKYGIDGLFWRSLTADRKRLQHTATAIGIKGLPGRPGLGLGHRPEIITTWTPDPSLTVLRAWIGADIEHYAPYGTPAAPTSSVPLLPTIAADLRELRPAAPPTATRAPRLVAAWFGGGQWPRLARVLEQSAREQCPDWDIDVRAITPDAARSVLGIRAFEANTSKLEYWRHAVCTAADGDRIALLDADTMVVQPLTPVWTYAFDLAYTQRRHDGTLPLNAGVIFVRVSDRTRRFLTQWRDENRRMLRDRIYHAPWRRKYGGMNQAAFGRLLEQTGPDALDVLPLPCLEWNCEDSSWAAFDPRVTRIVHLKSALRLALFGLGASPLRLRCRSILTRWRALDRAAEEAA